MSQPTIDGTLMMKFFYAALCNNKTKSITLSMKEINEVPDSFVQYLNFRYHPDQDKLEVSVKQGNIVIPHMN